jgi:L-seryl-tRNA(Ser) seleniumtransferase
MAADVVPLLCRITPAQAATTVHSYAGAIWLVLAALADNLETLISRSEMGDIEAGCPLSQIAASAGTTPIEVGSISRALAADYESSVTPRTALLLKVRPSGYRIVGDTASAELEVLVGLARERELTLADAIGTAPLLDLPLAVGIQRRSAQASLIAGVDLVILRGDGLVGGPPCGIILGNRELVARIANHPLHAAWQLDALRAAALAASLESYTASPGGESTVPMLQLLTTPLDNLRDRAERIAPQLAQAPSIANAEAIATHSPLFSADAPEDAPASFGIALTPADGDLAALEKRLQDAAHPVYGRCIDGRLVLDLRMVFPRQDQSLVEAVVGDQPQVPMAAG